MFGNVALLGAAAAVQPPLVAAVAYRLTRERPVHLLTVYLLGGLGLTLIVGAVVLFVLEGVGVGSGSSVPPEIEIVVGAVALVVAVAVSTGTTDRLRDRAQSHRSG
jgi:Sap, sulfolipid-1-addressing protein